MKTSMSIPKILIAGSGEKLQYLVHDHNDNTIRFVLYYQGIVDPDILFAATKALVGSVDILHSSFCADSVGAYWHVNQEYEDSSFFQYIHTEGSPNSTACDISLMPVVPEGKTQFCCCLVQSSQSSAVVVRISHLCVDGGDGKYLLEKLAEAYNLIWKTGSAQALVVKNGSRAAEQVYKNMKSKEILGLFKNPLSSVKTFFPFPDEISGRQCIVQEQISAQVMNVARRRAKDVGATANDLLLTAYYHAYAKLAENDANMPISIMSMMDLRRHCKNGESEGLCNMSGSLPTVLQDGVSSDFNSTLLKIADQTRAAKDDPLAGLYGMPLIHGAIRAVPMGLLLLCAGKVYGNMSLGLTNLGNIICDSIAMGEHVPTGGMFGGPLKKKPAVQISAASFDGNCSLCIVGQYTKEDTVLLQSMLSQIRKEVVQYA